MVYVIERYDLLTFLVRKGEEAYLVDPEDKVCTCARFIYNSKWCKHLQVIKEIMESKCVKCSNSLTVEDNKKGVCPSCGYDWSGAVVSPFQENPVAEFLGDSPEEDMKVIEAMERFGGSFVKQLAALARRADSVNMKKIKGTWPEYWEDYKKKI